MNINKQKLIEISRDLNKEEMEFDAKMVLMSLYKKNSMRIALKIKRIIRTQNITDEDMAKKLNISTALLKDYLSGEYNFSLSEIGNIEKSLDINIINKSLR